MATNWGHVNTGTNSLKLLLIGPKRTGKSSVGNTLLGRLSFETWGGASTTAAHGSFNGRQLSVVDTFGWGTGENHVPKREKLELLNGLSLCEPGPHALLLVLPLLRFTQSDRTALQRRMELLTEGAWRHTIVVFTLGDRLQGQTIQEYLQAGGEHLEWLLTKCRYRYRVLNNKTPFNREQVSGLLDHVEDMLMENGHWHFSLHMYRRLEEEWTRRELETLERMEKREGERRICPPTYQRRLALPNGNDGPLKVISHG
ncbi:GTPase IMAP family member 4 [Salminus brasiliensis]|uniref:GTPase IMAP family member 4 n=1 Tax=Salminus brasiliensis TaxID=930266 RepID=UPI003B83A02A